MTRRGFLYATFAATAEAALVLPVLHIADQRARLTPDRMRRFSSAIWPEAVRDFARCGIHLRSTPKPGEVRRSPGGRPRFEGLEHGSINMVLTDAIPLAWDRGRGLHGAATRHEGFDLCLVALNDAHPHQVPFLSVNTCVHEILHVLLDVFEGRPDSFRAAMREFRIDLYATRLWLFRDGAVIRRAAREYIAQRISGDPHGSHT